LSKVRWIPSPSILSEGPFVTTANFLDYPFSRGYIHITSKDVYSAPEFGAGFLSHPADLPPQIWSYKKVREIMRRMQCCLGECAPTHPLFPIGSAAACRDGFDPNESMKDIDYSEEDDLAIEEWVRSNVNTTWHSM